MVPHFLTTLLPSFRIFTELNFVNFYTLLYKSCINLYLCINRFECAFERYEDARFECAFERYEGAVSVDPERQKELPTRHLPQLETCPQRRPDHVHHASREPENSLFNVKFNYLFNSLHWELYYQKIKAHISRIYAQVKYRSRPIELMV